MGKKTKQRKPNNKSKLKSTNQASSSSTKEGATATTTTRKHDGAASENTNLPSLYAIYKYCTQNVIEWGKSTYLKQLSSTTSTTKKGGTTTTSTNKKQRRQEEKKKQMNNENLILEFNLSKIIFQCLGSLAKDGIKMPEPILNDLRIAISHRKRVATYYQAIPNVTTSRSFDSHQWIILQLERLEKIFSMQQPQKHANNVAATCTTTAGGGDANSSLFEKSNRFVLLSFSEDDDDDDKECADEDDGNVSSESNKQTRRRQGQPAPSPSPSSSSSPSAEELQAEERMFAVALVLTEISEAQMKLKNIWKKWASLSPTNDDEDASELLGATSCTEYTLSAIEKLVFETSMMLGDDDNDDMFNQMLKSYDDRGLLEDEIGPGKPLLLVINQCVTLRRLQKRPELNGRDGRVTQPMDENGLYAVELFPNTKDPKSYTNDDRNSMMKKKSIIISVKPENLVLSDNTGVRLSQVYEALQLFSFDSVPGPQSDTSWSDSVENTGTSLLFKHYDKFSRALKVGDFAGVLHLTVRHLLPLWVSFSRYIPDHGPANPVLQSYLREFDKSRGREIKFHFALALIVAIDSAFAVSEENAAREENARDVYAKVLKRTFDWTIYESAIDLFKERDRNPKMFYTSFEYARHYYWYQPMCCFFPWIGGELLLEGLRTHFVCGTGVPYLCAQELTTMLHIYWILRSEGILGKIAEIDDTLIRMYRKQVFFRGGVPQKGGNAYLKSWQLAIGTIDLNSARLLDGRLKERMGRRKPNKDILISGLDVDEVSKLRDILQWKTMPVRVGDIEFCHQQIMEIAKEEYYTMYTAPLMSACSNILRVRDSLRSLVPTAQASGERIAETNNLIVPFNDEAKICFWCASLAENRSLDKTEKQAGLSLVAKHFRDVFHEELRTDDKPSLNFSPYTYKFEKSLGVEAARSLRVKSKAHL